MKKKEKLEKIISTFEEYLGQEPKTYESYYDLEGSVWPDLYQKDESKNDDIASKTQIISMNKNQMFYHDLLLMAALNDLSLQEPEKEMKKEKKKEIQKLSKETIKALEKKFRKDKK